MLPPTAAGSSSAVEIRSSTLIELDVERLAHMGAAVAQDLHHRVLILDRIELRLHRLRLGHDLAERQRRREELDENHIHAGDYGHSVRGTQSLETTAIIAIRSLQKDFFAGGAGGIAKGARIGRSGDDTAMNCQPTLGQAPCFARPAAGPSGPASSAARPSPIPAPRRPGRSGRFHPLPRLRRPGHRPLLRGFVRAARAGCAGRITAWPAIVRRNARGAGARPARRAPAGWPARRWRKTTPSRSRRRYSRRSRRDTCARTPPAR